jgi:plastocyanin
MRRSRGWAIVAVVAGAASFACGGGGGGGGNGNNPTTSIAKAGAQSGDGQTATVGTAVANQLRVAVTEDGAAKAGATVTWSASAGSGTVTPTSSVTDASGIATTGWTLGTAAGTQTAKATLTGAAGSPVTFTATAVAGPAANFSKNAGDGQSAAVNSAFTTALAVKITDQFGNGVSGVVVDWAVMTGSVNLVGGATSTTNAQGVATKSITAGGTTGAATVQATTAAVAGTVTFNLTITTAPINVSVGGTTLATYNFTSGHNGTSNPAVDTIPVGGAVKWTNTSGTHSVASLGPPSFQSSGALSGNATYIVTFNAAGTYNYECGIHGSLMTGRIVVQ